MAQQFYTDLGLHKQCCPIVKFKDFSRPCSDSPILFKADFSLQGLFKNALYIQVLLKPVLALPCTFKSC